MELGVYAHPWDLRDLRAEGGLQVLRELGFSELSLASSYHAGKWLTPWSSAGVVRSLEDGTVHFPPSADYGELAPLASSEAKRSDPEWLSVGAAAQATGMTVRAWTVFLHNSRLGRAHPQSTVRNARGDRFSWALCPARPEVAAYARALAGDVGRLPGLGVLEVEALGWMGNRHGSHHAKAAFPDDAVTDFLLSYCFCSACERGLGLRGLDAEGLARRVVAALRARLTEGDAMAPPPACSAADARAELAEILGTEALAGMLEHRRAVLCDRLDDVRATVPSGVRIAAHLQWDVLFTGSQLGAQPAQLEGRLDELVATHYGQAVDRVLEAWSPGPAVPVGMARSVAVFPVAPHFRSEEDCRRLRAGLSEAGVTALRVYHAGLLPRRTLARVAAACAHE